MEYFDAFSLIKLIYHKREKNVLSLWNHIRSNEDPTFYMFSCDKQM